MGFGPVDFALTCILKHLKGYFLFIHSLFIYLFIVFMYLCFWNELMIWMNATPWEMDPLRVLINLY